MSTRVAVQKPQGTRLAHESVLLEVSERARTRASRSAPCEAVPSQSKAWRIRAMPFAIVRARTLNSTSNPSWQSAHPNPPIKPRELRNGTICEVLDAMQRTCYSSTPRCRVESLELESHIGANARHHGERLTSRMELLPLPRISCRSQERQARVHDAGGVPDQLDNVQHWQ